MIIENETGYSPIVKELLKQSSMAVNLPTPLLSILLAVFTVSPNRQYRGIFNPTTPATHGPEWIPMRKRNVSSGLCRILNSFIALSKWRDIDAISPKI